MIIPFHTGQSQSRGGGTANPYVFYMAGIPSLWTVVPRTGAFGVVRPGDVPTATFTVTPPSYAPNTSQTVHATADLGGSDTREAEVTVTVGG